MEYIQVEKTSTLSGSVQIQGSKNSALSLMAAACLSNNTSILENIPNISDVRTFIDILKGIGAKSGFIDTNRVLINPENINSTIIEPKNTLKVRPAYYFIGSLLARHKKVTVGYPGGDRIGERPIDQHIKGFELMGAKFEFFKDYYTITADKLIGSEIYFDVITAGATLNLMMAGVLAKGTTTLLNAARDPEVVDTAILLNKIGAKIYGAGTNRIRIDGVESLCGGSHTVIPDRLIAGTYLIATGITGGIVTVNNVIPEHLLPLVTKLKEININFIINENSITAYSDEDINSARILAEKFPMFETDFQQSASVLLLKAKGISTVTDKIYPQRFNHCKQLKKMGANIEWNNRTATIKGGLSLKGTQVCAEDIRSGSCLVLAGLLSEGTTQVLGLQHIQRGFTDIVGDLSKLGAKIKLMGSKDKNEEVGVEDTCLLKNAVMK